MPAAVTAAAGPVAVQTRQLYADSRMAAADIGAPVAGGSAAVAAGVMAFAAVGLLTVFRIVFKGAAL